MLGEKSLEALGQRFLTFVSGVLVGYWKNGLPPKIGRGKQWVMRSVRFWGQDLESSGHGHLPKDESVLKRAPAELLSPSGTRLEHTSENCFSFSTCSVYQAWEPVLN